MRARRRLGLRMLLACSMTGCASDHQVHELDPDEFSMHFSSQRSCKKYIDTIVIPTAQKISAKETREEMRAWLHNHPDDAFSELVARVQSDTLAHGALNPRRESDQMRVSMQLYEALRERPGFEASLCGPDVREFVMESLYMGVGGESAPVVAELRRRGIEDSWEQRWVLLTSLMAGDLATSAD